MSSEIVELRARIQAAEIIMAMALNDRPLIPVRRAITHYANRYPTPLAGKVEVLAEVSTHKILERLQRERLIWANACPCSCPACERLENILGRFAS